MESSDSLLWVVLGKTESDAHEVDEEVGIVFGSRVIGKVEVLSVPKPRCFICLLPLLYPKTKPGGISVLFLGQIGDRDALPAL